MQVTLSKGEIVIFKECTHGDYIKYLGKGQEIRLANEKGSETPVDKMDEIYKFGILQLVNSSSKSDGTPVTITVEFLDSLSPSDFNQLHEMAQSLYFPEKPSKEKKD